MGFSTRNEKWLIISTSIMAFMGSAYLFYKALTDTYDEEEDNHFVKLESPHRHPTGILSDFDKFRLA